LILSILGSLPSSTSIANFVDYGLIVVIDTHCQSSLFWAHLLLSTPIIDFIGLGPIAIVDLYCQFHQPQAHCHPSIVNFIGLKPIAVISLYR
jgi:hypothetical protein